MDAERRKFEARVRRWIRTHPDETLQILREAGKLPPITFPDIETEDGYDDDEF